MWGFLHKSRFFMRGFLHKSRFLFYADCGSLLFRWPWRLIHEALLKGSLCFDLQDVYKRQVLTFGTWWLADIYFNKHSVEEANYKKLLSSVA